MCSNKNIPLFYTIFLVLITTQIPESFARTNDDIAYAQSPSPLTSNCVNPEVRCFHQPADLCPKPESTCRCQRLPQCRRAAVCCNINQFQLIEGLACANITTNGEVEALHIRNATLDVLNVTLPAFKRLRYMTITDGAINGVVGEFAKHTIVQCLNLSSNEIVHFDNRSLVNLYNLSILDLSHNNLSNIPRFRKEGIVTLDISANKGMLCSNLFEALKRSEQLKFNNENDTLCLSPNNYHWFNSTDFVRLSQVIGVHELRKSCRQNCSCEPARLDFIDGNLPAFAVSIDCSGLGLESLPTPLPAYTVVLNISNNNITSLDLLRTDSTYKYIRELFADNNQITSILPLEGFKSRSKFKIISLRNNKIKSLPTYVFSNLFDRNDFYSRHINLGHNRLQCDCNTAKVLKVWLLAKQKNIPDYDDIYCDNMEAKVIDLNPSKLCISQQRWTDYIYYIITGEVLLLVGLIGKVFYDYWRFKTSGYLPWPASKMPKLPCDWLCE